MLPRQAFHRGSSRAPPNEQYPGVDQEPIGSYGLDNSREFFGFAIAQSADQDDAHGTAEPIGKIALRLAEAKE